MIMSHDEHVIVAQSTPAGAGAIGIVRLSGTNVLQLVTRMSRLASGKKISDAFTHTIHYGNVIDQDNHCIDQVLFMVMHGPKTFTGQDTVEINCHNNPFIVEAIIEASLAAGARMAQNGEFTRRAVSNNKIDLIQAEAINELIHANTQLSLKQSLAQLQGSFSHWITNLEKNLVKALAFCEASFEFIDEQITFDQQIIQIIQQSLESINTIKKTFDKQQHIRQGIRIAIIGSVNAGKSSLFNALVGSKRAIVTDIAGTTRDTIEFGLYKNGNYWTLIDTAGLRQTDDFIEQEGIKRSFEQAHLADIILLVIDGSRTLSVHEQQVYENIRAQYHHKIVSIYNKIDLAPTNINLTNINSANINLERTNQNPALTPNSTLTVNKISAVTHNHNSAADHNTINESVNKPIAISTKNNIGIDQVELRIQTAIDALFQTVESPFLLNQRQLNLILSLEIMLQQILLQMRAHQDNVPHELISYHLNDALTHISQLTGKSISEQGMDAVFREFCVGK